MHFPTVRNASFRSRMRRWAVGLAAAALLLGGGTATVGAQRSAIQQTADSLFSQQKWTAAEATYASVTAAEPSNGAAWSNLGESRLQQRELDGAIAAFAKAEGLRFRPFLNIVNQARAFAEKGDDARVMSLLQRVIDGGAGGSLKSLILGATAFARYAHDPRWEKLVSQMKACTAAPFRQFDFWVGDWDVYAGGAVAGHNLVTLEQDGCLLVEHWTSNPAGQTGTSFNYYDIRDKLWHQLYIDNSGNAGAFPAMAGSLVDGKMVLFTEDTNNKLSRWTWYVMEPGKVKQMAELSTDHGQTWQVTWNSEYVKKGEKR